MAARSAAAATAACHALRRALRVDKLLAQASRLRGCYDCCFLGAAAGSSSTSAAAAVGAVVLCAAAAFPRAAAFFLPLVASTSLCCAAAWLFAADAAKEEAAGGGVEVIVREGRGKAGPEPGLLQVIGDANASAYGAGAGGGVQVGCFLRRSARCGVDEDGDEVVFAGSLAPRCAAGGGALETMEAEEAVDEELAAMRVDSLAQGVWDSYFGGWSRWHDAYAAY